MNKVDSALVLRFGLVICRGFPGEIDEIRAIPQSVVKKFPELLTRFLQIEILMIVG